MKSSLSFLFFSIVFAIAFSYSLGDVFWSPNSFQSDMSGDGLKNYYTFAYHLKNYNGWWFEGFLYPYGDYTLYTDNQIFLIWILKGFNFIGIDVSDYALGILNTLPMISFPLGSLIIYKIFIHYKMDRFWASFFALICLLMSPQLFRLQAHFALGYACLLPAAWYMIIRYRSSKRWSYLVYLTVLMMISAFIHPYILLSMGLLTGSIFMGMLIRKKRFNWRILLPAIIAFASFLVITKLTDTNKEYRPQNPWGADAFKTELSDVMPIAGIHNELLKPVLELRQNYHEGYCYPSMLLFFVLGILLVFLFNKFVNRSKDLQFLSDGLEGDLKDYIIASLLILFFSMGLHFILTDGYIFELLPPLRQFRGVGRMSWGFYYIAFVYLSIISYRKISSVRSSLWRSLAFSFVVICLVYESIALLGLFKEGIERYDSPDLLTSQTNLLDVLKSKKIEVEDLQGIITLPIGTEGAEKIGLKDDWEVKINAIPLSYQTALPMTTCILSRASLEAVSKVLQVGNSAYGKMDLINDMDVEKDLLVVVPNKHLVRYQDILSRSELLSNLENISLYKIDPDSLAYRKYFKDYVFEHSIDSFDQEVIFFDDYENQNNGIGLLSDHSYYLENTLDTLLSLPLAVNDNKETTASVWFKLDEEDSSLAAFIVKLYDQDGNEVYRRDYRDWAMDRVEVHDRWVRYTWDIPMWPSHSKLVILVESEKLHIDRLLILEKSQHFKTSTKDPNWIQVDHLLMKSSEDDF